VYGYTAYRSLGVGGTAVEQDGHNIYVPLLTSDEQRRGSTRLHKERQGSCRRGMDHGLKTDTRKQGSGLTFVPLPIDNT
jgi:hypothetical protein